MPSTTLLEIPPAEQAQMRASLRRDRYGYMLAFHVLLLCADGRTPAEMAAFLFCSRFSVYRTNSPISMMPLKSQRWSRTSLPRNNPGLPCECTNFTRTDLS